MDTKVFTLNCNVLPSQNLYPNKNVRNPLNINSIFDPYFPPKSLLIILLRECVHFAFVNKSQLLFFMFSKKKSFVFIFVA